MNKVTTWEDVNKGRTRVDRLGRACLLRNYRVSNGAAWSQKDEKMYKKIEASLSPKTSKTSKTNKTKKTTSKTKPINKKESLRDQIEEFMYELAEIDVGIGSDTVDKMITLVDNKKK